MSWMADPDADGLLKGRQVTPEETIALIHKERYKIPLRHTGLLLGGKPNRR
jgi:hypothetical protein